jgi:hypothetical protein
MRIADKNNQESGGESVFKDSAKEYKEEALKAWYSGPQRSVMEFLRQMECHERKYKLYDSGDLPKCHLSFFHEVTKEKRWALLDWLGSEITLADIKGTTTNPPPIPRRLHKIPAGRDY